ncbi:MAG TPA: hypothetical protein VNA22_07620 [Pyrinomonadaceae bacterium]|nr:hypothetical protein [Pyrinomonadaceae bacterium]
MADLEIEVNHADMDEELPEQIVNTVRKMISLLAEKRYSEIVTWTNGERYPEREIEAVIVDYDVTVVHPPDSFYPPQINALRIDNTSPQEWSVVFPLWTAEEGESDLSVELTCTEGEGVVCADVDFDSLHVR